MPAVRVSMLPGRSAEQKAKLVAKINEGFAEIGVPAEAVTTIIEEVDAGDWYIANESIAEKRAKS
jgi:4-oxalocrotonate tautomerase family enzyme